MRRIRIFFTLLFLAACVEPIEFDTQESAPLLVVEGLISPSAPLSLRLSYTSAFGTFREPALAAQVLLYDEAGNFEQYSPISDDPGLYQLPAERLSVSVGSTYYVEIQMEDGDLYRSQPETVPPAVTPDSLSFDVTVEDFTTEEGGVQRKAFFNLYLNSPIAENQHLRWTGSEVYSFVDLACGGLDQATTCYYSKGELNPQSILLYSARDNASTYLNRYPLMTRELRPTYEFEARHCFNVYQQSITPQAYAYWEDINRILTLDGSLFDTPPAAVRGNIYNVNDEDELVLGYVSAASVDTVRLFTSPPEVRSYIPFPYYCQGRSLGAPNANDPPACCFCTALETDDELIGQPSYW